MNRIQKYWTLPRTALFDPRHWAGANTVCGVLRTVPLNGPNKGYPYLVLSVVAPPTDTTPCGLGTGYLPYARAERFYANSVRAPNS